MFGARFELDEEKILRENIYNLGATYAMVEELATKRAGTTKVSKNHYEFREEKNVQAHLGISVFNCLGECDWFTRNLKKWYWLSGECVEYIMSSMKTYKGVWE